MIEKHYIIYTEILISKFMNEASINRESAKKCVVIFSEKMIDYVCGYKHQNRFWNQVLNEAKKI